MFGDGQAQAPAAPQGSGYGADQLANFPGFSSETQRQDGLFGAGSIAASSAPTPAFGDDEEEGGHETGVEIKARAQQSLLESLGNRLYDPSLSEDDLSELVVQHLAEFFSEEDVSLSPAERQRLTREVTDDLLRHGPIEPFLSDPAVSEVMVNGTKAIYVEKSGKLVLTKVRFANEQQLRRVIERIVGRVGRRIDESSPMVDARLPDGSRVNAIIPPLGGGRLHAHHS